ncbi:RluA family pseudouridine synthase [Paenibacillus aurantiacus]|uniref:Pseudouridine synthase n=1 Tax=Paenibacillus aurantiacus TaxID=1936118 RepID=A0ABV5KT83_9BACL
MSPRAASKGGRGVAAPRPGERRNERRGERESSARPEKKRNQERQYAVLEQSELLPFLLLHLKDKGRNAVKSMLARGQIAVNGEVVKLYNHLLQPGATVAVSHGLIVERAPLIGLRILHEDDDLIVVHKDSGLLSIASDKENELTAYRQLTAHVREADPASRIFVVHRLDRDTSGVMMFAKSEYVQQQLQNDWQNAVTERSYIALVEGWVKKSEGTVTSWLKESKTLKMYSSPYPNDGQHAVTHYKTLETNKTVSLLEVRLETGRKNQIRVHMEDIGHPIVGDKKYGARLKLLNRLGLHARVLAFVHPTSGESMRFETDIPKSFLQPFQTGESTPRHRN